jgi:hypothetical protein
MPIESNERSIARNQNRQSIRASQAILAQQFNELDGTARVPAKVDQVQLAQVQAQNEAIISAAKPADSLSNPVQVKDSGRVSSVEPVSKKDSTQLNISLDKSLLPEPIPAAIKETTVKRSEQQQSALIASASTDAVRTPGALEAKPTLFVDKSVSLKPMTEEEMKAAANTFDPAKAKNFSATPISNDLAKALGIPSSGAGMPEVTAISASGKEPVLTATSEVSAPKNLEAGTAPESVNVNSIAQKQVAPQTAITPPDSELRAPTRSGSDSSQIVDRQQITPVTPASDFPPSKVVSGESGNSQPQKSNLVAFNDAAGQTTPIANISEPVSNKDSAIRVPTTAEVATVVAQPMERVSEHTVVPVAKEALTPSAQLQSQLQNTDVASNLTASKEQPSTAVSLSLAGAGKGPEVVGTTTNSSSSDTAQLKSSDPKSGTPVAGNESGNAVQQKQSIATVADLPAQSDSAANKSEPSSNTDNRIPTTSEVAKVVAIPVERASSTSPPTPETQISLAPAPFSKVSTQTTAIDAVNTATGSEPSTQAGALSNVNVGSGKGLEGMSATTPAANSVASLVGEKSQSVPSLLAPEPKVATQEIPLDTKAPAVKNQDAKQGNGEQALAISLDKPVIEIPKSVENQQISPSVNSSPAIIPDAQSRAVTAYSVVTEPQSERQPGQGKTLSPEIPPPAQTVNNPNTSSNAEKAQPEVRVTQPQAAIANSQAVEPVAQVARVISADVAPDKGPSANQLNQPSADRAGTPYVQTTVDGPNSENNTKYAFDSRFKVSPMTASDIANGADRVVLADPKSYVPDLTAMQKAAGLPTAKVETPASLPASNMANNKVEYAVDPRYKLTPMTAADLANTHVLDFSALKEPKVSYTPISPATEKALAITPDQSANSQNNTAHQSPSAKLDATAAQGLNGQIPQESRQTSLRLPQESIPHSTGSDKMPISVDRSLLQATAGGIAKQQEALNIRLDQPIIPIPTVSSETTATRSEGQNGRIDKSQPQFSKEAHTPDAVVSSTAQRSNAPSGSLERVNSMPTVALNNSTSEKPARLMQGATSENVIQAKSQVGSSQSLEPVARTPDAVRQSSRASLPFENLRLAEPTQSKVAINSVDRSNVLAPGTRVETAGLSTQKIEQRSVAGDGTRGVNSPLGTGNAPNVVMMRDLSQASTQQPAQKNQYIVTDIRKNEPSGSRETTGSGSVRFSQASDLNSNRVSSPSIANPQNDRARILAQPDLANNSYLKPAKTQPNELPVLARSLAPLDAVSGLSRSNKASSVEQFSASTVKIARNQETMQPTSSGQSRTVDTRTVASVQSERVVVPGSKSNLPTNGERTVANTVNSSSNKGPIAGITTPDNSVRIARVLPNGSDAQNGRPVGRTLPGVGETVVALSAIAAIRNARQNNSPEVKSPNQNPASTQATTSDRKLSGRIDSQSSAQQPVRITDSKPANSLATDRPNIQSSSRLVAGQVPAADATTGKGNRIITASASDVSGRQNTRTLPGVETVAALSVLAAMRNARQNSSSDNRSTASNQANPINQTDRKPALKIEPPTNASGQARVVENKQTFVAGDKSPSNQIRVAAGMTQNDANSGKPNRNNIISEVSARPVARTLPGVETVAALSILAAMKNARQNSPSDNRSISANQSNQPNSQNDRKGAPKNEVQPSNAQQPRSIDTKLTASDKSTSSQVRIASGALQNDVFTGKTIRNNLINEVSGRPVARTLPGVGETVVALSILAAMKNARQNAASDNRPNSAIQKTEVPPTGNQAARLTDTKSAPSDKVSGNSGRVHFGFAQSDMAAASRNIRPGTNLLMGDITNRPVSRTLPGVGETVVALSVLAAIRNGRQNQASDSASNASGQTKFANTSQLANSFRVDASKSPADKSIDTKAGVVTARGLEQSTRILQTGTARSNAPETQTTRHGASDRMNFSARHADRNMLTPDMLLVLMSTAAIARWRQEKIGQHLAGNEILEQSKGRFQRCLSGSSLTNESNAYRAFLQVNKDKYEIMPQEVSRRQSGLLIDKRLVVGTAASALVILTAIGRMRDDGSRQDGANNPGRAARLEWNTIGARPEMEERFRHIADRPQRTAWTTGPLDLPLEPKTGERNQYKRPAANAGGRPPEPLENRDDERRRQSFVDRYRRENEAVFSRMNSSAVDLDQELKRLEKIKAKPDESRFEQNVSRPSGEDLVERLASETDRRRYIHSTLFDSQDLTADEDDGSETEESKLEKEADSRAAAHASSVAVRPTCTISVGETLVSIAERYLQDGDLAWLIADLNKKRFKERWFEGKRIIEIASRQTVELPFFEEVEQFYRQKTRDMDAENLVTIVHESQLEREALNSLNMVLGFSRNKQPKESQGGKNLRVDEAVDNSQRYLPSVELIG